MLDKTNMTIGIPGDESGPLILSTMERVERLHEERDAIAADISDIFLEAKSKGLCVKTLKALIKERAQDPAKRTEMETMLELYRSAVSRARTREA